MITIPLLLGTLLALGATQHAGPDLLEDARSECAAIDSCLAHWDTEELVTLDYSTEGGVIRMTRDEEGEPRRLFVNLCGEMGQASWQAYYLTEDRMYFVEEKVRYNAHLFDEEWDEDLSVTTTDELLIRGTELLVWLRDGDPQPVIGNEAREAARSARSDSDEFLGRIELECVEESR